MLRDLFSLFPACAGVIPYEDLIYRKDVTFPRMCGGDPRGYAISVPVNTFSPHVRG